MNVKIGQNLPQKKVFEELFNHAALVKIVLFGEGIHLASRDNI